MDIPYVNEKFLMDLFNKLFAMSLKVIVVMILMIVAWVVARVMIRRLENYWKGQQGSLEDQKRTGTLISIILVFVKIFLFILGIMLVLSQLGINLGPLLATAGLGGLAIGFGGQTLVRDLLSGFFLLLENQIRVGDVVEIAGTGGVVEKITLRTVTLRDLGGNVHIIPHSTIDKVTNRTKGFSYYVFDIGVAYKENTDHVVKILKEVGEQIQKDEHFASFILEPLEVLGLDEFSDSAIIIKARIKTKPIHQWTVGREMNRRIKIAFDREGIEIPFPHRTLVYAGGVSQESDIRKAS